MDIEKAAIKSSLLSLFRKGKSEVEAYEEISKIHGSNLVTLSAVNKWFKAFRSEEHTTDIKKKHGRKPKFTDEFLINLINENPDLNMSELARLANTSVPTISNRLKQIDINGESLYYKVNINNKAVIFLKDEDLIKLINENPDINMEKLSKLAGTSIQTISNRLKRINCNEQIVSYCKKGFQNGAKKFTDEYLINLIKENPGLNMCELAALASTCQPTISNRLKQINNNRPDNDKIILHNHISKAKDSPNYITDEYLIKLVNDNPSLNMAELAKLANTSAKNISRRLKQINKNEERVVYIKKRYPVKPKSIENN